MAEVRFHPPPRVQDHLHLRIFEARSLDIDRNWNARNVRSSYWRLYVNNRDGASLLLTDRTYPLRRQRVHFVPAWVPFTCQCVRRLRHFYVHFDVVGLPGSLVREVFDSSATLGVEPELERQIAAVSERVAGEAVQLADLLSVKSVVYRALASLVALLPAHKAARFREAAGGDDPISPALRHIEATPGRTPSNAELAALCHLSPDHFIRRFRARVGQTPAKYVLERRIALAAQRLSFTRDKIEQIAADCGFANRFYFSRAFARVMGVSPARYRRTDRI